MPLAFFNPSLEFSPQSLAGRIKTELTEFFTQATQQDSKLPDEANDLLVLLHQGKINPQKLYIDFNAEIVPWPSATILTANDFDRICYAITRSLDRFIRSGFVDSPDRDEKINFIQAEFREPSLTHDHLLLMSKFGDFLRDKYIYDTTNDAYTITEENNLAIEKFLQGHIAQYLIDAAKVESIPLSDDETALLNQVATSLVRIIESRLIDKAGREYSGFADFLEKLSDSNDLTRIELLEHIKNKIAVVFPGHLAGEDEPAKLIAFKYDGEEEPYSIFRAHSLLFTYPREETDLTELLALDIPKSQSLKWSRDRSLTTEIIEHCKYNEDAILYDSKGVIVYSGNIDWRNLDAVEGPYYVLQPIRVGSIPDSFIIDQARTDFGDESKPPVQIDLDYLRLAASSIIYKGQLIVSRESCDFVHHSNLCFPKPELRKIEADLQALKNLELDPESTWIKQELIELKSWDDGSHQLKNMIWVCCSKLNWIWNKVDLEQGLGFLNMFVVELKETLSDLSWGPSSWIANPNFIDSSFNVKNKFGNQFDPRFIFLPVLANQAISSRSEQKLTVFLKSLGLDCPNTEYRVIEADAASRFAIEESSVFVLLDKSLAKSIEASIYTDALASHAMTLIALDQCDLASDQKDFIAASAEAQISLELELILRLRDPAEDSQMKNYLETILIDKFGQDNFDQMMELIRAHDYLSIGDFQKKLEVILGLNGFDYGCAVRSIQADLRSFAQELVSA